MRCRRMLAFLQIHPSLLGVRQINDGGMRQWLGCSILLSRYYESDKRSLFSSDDKHTTNSIPKLDNELRSGVRQDCVGYTIGEYRVVQHHIRDIRGGCFRHGYAAGQFAVSTGDENGKRIVVARLAERSKKGNGYVVKGASWGKQFVFMVFLAVTVFALANE